MNEDGLKLSSPRMIRNHQQKLKYYLPLTKDVPTFAYSRDKLLKGEKRYGFYFPYELSY